jgi:DNA-binding CsgD family transcriptional regulator
VRSSGETGATQVDADRAVVDLREAVDKLDLPLALIDLDSWTVSAISRSALRRLGVAPAAVVGRPVASVFVSRDRVAVEQALAAMRDGAIDLYRAHRRIGSLDDQDHVVTAWVRRLRLSDRTMALAEFARGGEPRRSPLADYLGREPVTMVVGTTDDDWVITSISEDVETLLGYPAASATGRRFLCSVDQRDVRRLLGARGEAQGECSVAVRVRLEDDSGAWIPLMCVLTSLAGSDELCFILLPESEAPGDDTIRATRLEQHLVAIAAEIRASGVLQEVAHLPEPARLARVGGLTSRQLEVLGRLLRGERVPTIAKALFVSQSTVRNHLAAIFERFGVHSQAELLEKIAEETTDDPST